MIIIDPITRQRVLCDKHSDVNYLLNGDDAIAKEDVPMIGPWSDYTGSDINISSRSQQQFSSHENQLQWTEPNIEHNVHLPQLSIIGTNAGTHRRRIILRHAEIKDGKAVVEITPVGIPRKTEN